MHGERLRVRVSAAPVGGAANQRLIELLADRLRLPRGAIRVHRGEHARDKEVLIAGAASQYAQVVAKLLPGTS